MDDKTKAEVVLTPYLKAVAAKARGMGFDARPLLGDGMPWLLVALNAANLNEMTISVWRPDSYILSTQAQNVEHEQLVANAQRVAAVAAELLAVRLCRICKKAEAEPDSSRFDPLCQPCADAWLESDEASDLAKHERYLDAKDRHDADAFDRAGDR